MKIVATLSVIDVDLPNSLNEFTPECISVQRVNKFLNDGCYLPPHCKNVKRVLSESHWYKLETEKLCYGFSKVSHPFKELVSVVRFDPNATFEGLDGRKVGYNPGSWGLIQQVLEFRFRNGTKGIYSRRCYEHLMHDHSEHDLVAFPDHMVCVSGSWNTSLMRDCERLDDSINMFIYKHINFQIAGISCVPSNRGERECFTHTHPLPESRAGFARLNSTRGRTIVYSACTNRAPVECFALSASDKTLVDQFGNLALLLFVHLFKYFCDVALPLLVEFLFELWDQIFVVLLDLFLKYSLLKYLILFLVVYLIYVKFWFSIIITLLLSFVFEHLFD